jgi:glutathione S-transferase
MKAFGNGKPDDLPSTEALDIAKESTREPTKVAQSDPSGLKAGQKISVIPDDTGKVPVTGTLVGLAPERVSIARSDPRVGDVVVHFPRAGFVIATS